MLKAGTSVADITPRKPLALFGYPHVERVSTGVHDPLLAAALHVSDGTRSCILVALDLLFLDTPTARELRSRIARNCGIPEAGVFIGCTHTHSGPVTLRMLAWRNDTTIPPPDPEYMEWMKQQVVTAAADSVRKAHAVESAWTRADATGVGGNRHSVDGATDPGAGVLVLRAPGTAKPVAILVVYGMHPTVMHEDSTLISSDFPHYTRQQLKDRYGAELPVLYFTAPAGNQSPRRHVTAQTFAEAERLGRRLGQAVVDGIEAIPSGAFSADAVVDGVLAHITLPRRPLVSVAAANDLLRESRRRWMDLRASGAPRAEVRTAECDVFGAESTLGLAEASERGELERELAPYAKADLQVVRVGNFRLAGLPGELFTEYSLEIKRRAPDGTFPVSLVNGELQGYVVTPESAAAGGYEAANSIFAPEAGAVLVDGILRLIKG